MTWKRQGKINYVQCRGWYPKGGETRLRYWWHWHRKSKKVLRNKSQILELLWPSICIICLKWIYTNPVVDFLFRLCDLHKVSQVKREQLKRFWTELGFVPKALRRQCMGIFVPLQLHWVLIALNKLSCLGLVLSSWVSNQLRYDAC